MSKIIRNYCITKKGVDTAKVKCGKKIMKSFAEHAKKETDGILKASLFRKASPLSINSAESMNDGN